MEEITLTNVNDQSNARRGLTPKHTVRQITVAAMPDTGAWTLVINEEIRRALGLDIVDRVSTTLADGSTGEADLTGPVQVRWKERWADCNAVVMPGAADVLLGALPLEGMDLMVDPVNKRLAGVHGDERLYLVM
jgi:clan AA aspartic protease